MSEQFELPFENNPFVLRLTIDDGLWFFWENYWKDLPKGRSTKKCLVRLICFFKEIAKINFIDQVSKVHIEDLRKWLYTFGFSHSTVNTHHMIFVRWVNKLYDWKEAKIYKGIDFAKIVLPLKNPGSLVKKVKEIAQSGGIPWPKRVIYRIIDAANRLKDYYMADFLETLYLAGLRPSDVGRMIEKNVDFGHMHVTGIQHKTVTSKLPSGIPYLIAITPRMALILKRRINCAPPGAPIFGSAELSYESWYKEISRRFSVIRAAAGAKHVQIRHFRGAGSTLLMDNGIDIETIREKYGWTTLRMIPTYAKRTMVHQRKAQLVLEDEETEILL